MQRLTKKSQVSTNGVKDIITTKIIELYLHEYLYSWADENHSKNQYSP